MHLPYYGKQGRLSRRHLASCLLTLICYQSLLGQQLQQSPARVALQSFGADLSMPPAETLPLPLSNGPGEAIRAEGGLIEEVPESLREQQESARGDLTDQTAPLGGEQIPAGSGEPASVAAGSVAETIDQRLTPADVIASVFRSYPEINQARLVARQAQGERIEASGAYDLKFKAATISEPTGFYENYRNGLGVARQAWWGTHVMAGYRIGRGDFQPWYRERETEKGGEFKVGLIQPLLQGRAIDEQRVALFRASLAQQAADPILQEAILATSRDATLAYWQWVAWGAVLQAQRELLTLAETRGEQFVVGVNAGKFAEIDLILNQQLIAERKAKVLETERKYRESAIKLSMYLRDNAGNPLLPADEWIPTKFPVIESLPAEGIEGAIALALDLRPEPRRMQFEIRQLDLDRALARNQTLPQLDLILEGSQDVGEPGSSADDKGPFELVVGAQSEVPIQRRKALGKQQATTAKILQLQEKLRLQRDKIALEVRAAYNNLQLSAQVIEQADQSLRAAVESLDRYRFAFERGKIDLIYLNLLESKANETEIKLIEAQEAWFAALAQFQAAGGLDPLDQASLVSELPDSDRPGPGRLPHRDLPKPADLDRDWQRRTGGAAPVE
jgi:outer membrane protein TolC